MTASPQTDLYGNPIRRTPGERLDDFLDRGGKAVLGWAIFAAVMVGLMLWLSNQPPTPGLCVQQGPELVCPE